MTNMPAITVLMPACNAGGYIAEAIESVLAQTFTSFELLIINDGSTDETEAVLQQFTDSRIRVIHQSNTGIAAALNTGLTLATAPYIARFDADDYCMPQRLEKQYAFLQTHPDYVIVGCDADYTGEGGEYVFTYRLPAHTDEEIRQLPLWICPFIHSGVMYRKQAVMDAGGYDVHAHSFEDHLLWHKVLAIGKGYNLSAVLLRVRLNPQSVTIDEQWRPAAFIQLKHTALREGSVSAAAGRQLLALLASQENGRLKEGAYHSLLAKKYLWDNHQPAKARVALRLLLRQYPTRVQGYGLYLLSYLPERWIRWLYERRTKKINVHAE